MKDIPLGALSLKGGFGIERILDFSMDERMGGHFFARITGTAQMTNSGYWGFEGAIANKAVEVFICGEEVPLFTGIIQEVEAAEENGLHLVKLCIASGSAT